MLRFDPLRASIAALLFAAEVCIALCVHDHFIRPYVGDVLVVMLIFFTMAAVLPVRPAPLAIGVLCFAVAIEATQAIGLIQRLGWSDSALAKLVLGNTFQWADLVCYLVGSMASLGIVRLIPSGQRSH